MPQLFEPALPDRRHARRGPRLPPGHHLGPYHAAVRLVLHGEETEPFTMTTSPLPPPTPGRAREIRRAIRARTAPASTAPTGTATAPPPTHPPLPAVPDPAASRPRHTDPRRSR